MPEFAVLTLEGVVEADGTFPAAAGLGTRMRRADPHLQTAIVLRDDDGPWHDGNGLDVETVQHRLRERTR